MLNHLIFRYLIRRKLKQLQKSPDTGAFDREHIHCRVIMNKPKKRSVNYQIHFYCYCHHSQLSESNNWYLIGKSGNYAKRVKAEIQCESLVEQLSSELCEMKFYKRRYYPDLDMEGEDLLCHQGLWVEYSADAEPEPDEYADLSFEELLAFEEP
ncbi:hypothetical protein [Dongshaea marina]|uniref:hypothetical protein n=1 Tax=Dongshaea marina TaxID=2047966 RepID=UPI000D3ED0A1|nr:hypothetical protein [Dongshaea marina]